MSGALWLDLKERAPPHNQTIVVQGAGEVRQGETRERIEIVTPRSSGSEPFLGRPFERWPRTSVNVTWSGVWCGPWQREPQDFSRPPPSIRTDGWRACRARPGESGSPSRSVARSPPSPDESSSRNRREESVGARRHRPYLARSSESREGRDRSGWRGTGTGMWPT